MAEWTDTVDQTAAWTDPAFDTAPIVILEGGSPIGLLLALTYAANVDDLPDIGTSVWTDTVDPTATWN